MASPALTRFRIREFGLDAATRELRKAGTLVKLQERLFQALAGDKLIETRVFA